MSASREKKSRQELNTSGYIDPKITRAAEEKAKARRSNILYAVLGIAFVAVAAIAIVANSHVIERNAKAYTVNGETFTAADVNYYYRNAYNSFVNQNSAQINYYFDTSKDLREQECSFADGSWFDYFADQAFSTINQVSALAKEAKAQGFDAAEAEEAALATDYSYIDTYAAMQGYTRAQYLQGVFGSTMTTKVFERNVRLVALAEAYRDAYTDSLTYSDAEIQAAYDADPTAYQSADIEFAIFTYTAESDATDDEKTDLLAEAKETAQTALSRYADGESFEALAEELGGTYYHQAHASRSVYSEMLNWAFDDARRSGDTTIVPYGENGFYAAVFHSCTRNDYRPVSVRHILVETEEIANSVLKQYLAGEQTEEAFGALAAQYSSDGNAASGGLYEDIALGQMVEPFETWCFDSSRKSGDTGIVETDYGFHVMYFVETNPLEYWKVDAQNDLRTADFNEWINTLTENIESEELGGMKYVG